MRDKGKTVYPYIPNSVPEVKESMLKELGMQSVEDIYKEIPDRLRFKGKMNMPEAILSEARLQRHVEDILAKNKNCKNNISFLGGGCWDHYVPAVCDTIAARDEFLTCYVGDAYSDHGKFQALFETSSMIGDLTGFEVCNTPTYDWANAIAIACRMASRTTGRKEILVPESMSPGRYLVVKNYCKPDIDVVKFKFDFNKMCLDLDDLRSKVSEKTSAVYFENPSYLGFIETQGKDIVDIAHKKGALVIMGTDPISLGVLEAPGIIGADYAVGEYQPLGLHMSWGGGLGGFIATKDEKKFIAEYPSLLFGITTSIQDGEYAFGEVFYERTSYASREKGKDFIGTCAALHGIVAGVYLALMGPQGIKELGEGIMQRVTYAKKELAKINGIKIYNGYNFKEFVVNFNDCGESVAEINKALLDRGIFGGRDLSKEFPQLSNSALYAITEVHTKADINTLIKAIAEVC